MEEKIKKLIEILKEIFPDGMDLNDAAQKLGMSPSELIKEMNDHPDLFMDIEIKTNWEGRKLLRYRP